MDASCAFLPRPAAPLLARLAESAVYAPRGSDPERELRLPGAARLEEAT